MYPRGYSKKFEKKESPQLPTVDVIVQRLSVPPATTAAAEGSSALGTYQDELGQLFEQSENSKACTILHGNETIFEVYGRYRQCSCCGNVRLGL